MPKYQVEYDGIWNGEYYSGESVLELTDEEVKTLVNLIKENDGETDIEALGLKDKYPAIYDAFHEAFLQPVSFDGSLQWAVDGYFEGYFDGPSDEEILRIVESESLYDFKFEYNEGDYLDEDGEFMEEQLMEDKCQAWRDFFSELPSDDQLSFLDRFFKKQIYEFETQELSGDMYIPEEIIEMANSE
jgi:hypothetical protein